MIDELGKQAQDRLVSGDGRRGRYFGTAVVPTLYHVSRTRFEPLERGRDASSVLCAPVCG